MDLDRNGCDVRNDVLRRDLSDLVIKPGTSGCVVETGVLADPYSGTVISFVRGADTSGDVQIDHVVALSDAWQKGAQAWDGARMRQFGNDPLNLLAVDGPLNAQKGDGDTATWLPPNRAVRCAYVARQVAVKAGYQLWVTEAEREAMVRVLSTCPDEPLPVGETAPLAPELEAAPVPVPVQAPAPAAGAGEEPRFGTCKEALAAGYGPYVSGRDPEYGWYRDGDSDGVVCES
ncbi:GmrSD restriction endonuclease domain-containing protein [Georgenia sp. SUBG003]|uniref:GmrSD restriction endonuclease domain-containing protein n=1 Tax=Georgenia sp. SUBG003 TaxID=1497974 RepID=UPI000A85DE4B